MEKMPRKCYVTNIFRGILIRDFFISVKFNYATASQCVECMWQHIGAGGLKLIPLYFSEIPTYYLQLSLTKRASIL